MRKIKSLFSIVLVVCLCMALFAACSKKVTNENNESTVDPTLPAVTTTPEITEPAKSSDPLDMITDGYYSYTFNAPSYGDFTQYFHFYKEQPVLGAIFYASFSNNGPSFAGTYTVEKIDYNYEVFTTREEATTEGAQKTKGIVPYTITFYDWDGNVIEQCGFDGKSLYNDMENIYATGSGPMIYQHDTDGDTSKYAEIYAGEIGVKYLDFVSDTDVTSTVTLYHNGAYADLMSMMVEGTWSMAENSNGGFDYTLTPNDPVDTAAVLSIVADKKTATYTPKVGDAIAMTNTAFSGPEITGVFTGTQNVAAYKTDGELTLNLYSDGTCEVFINLFGNIGSIDTGTYTVDNNQYDMNFTVAGQIKSERKAETQDITVPYKATVDQIGDIDTELTLDQSTVVEAAAPAVLFSFEGGYCTFDLYDNNTFKFAYEAYQVEETGSWVYDAKAYKIIFTKSDGSAIETMINSTDNSMSFEYAAVVSDQLKDTFTCPSETWGVLAQ